MPRESRSPNLELFARLALLFTSAGFFIAGCNGQLAFDSPASGGSAQGAGSPGSGGNSAGSGNSAGAGMGNTGGGNWLNRGPEACLDDTDCGLPGLHCQTASHQCVECLVDQHCPAERRACSQSIMRCVECDATVPCADGKFCDLQSGKCLTRCHSYSNCDPSTTLYCDFGGLCAACDDDGECNTKLGGTHCQRSASACVQCLADQQCGGLTPRCLLPQGACVACVDSGDCASPAPYCDPALHRCSAAEH